MPPMPPIGILLRGLTEQALTERAPGARSWGAPRARRGPGVGPTTLTAQGRQIRAPPPAHALGLASRLLITPGPLLGPHRRTDFYYKDRLYQGEKTTAVDQISHPC